MISNVANATIHQFKVSGYVKTGYQTIEESNYTFTTYVLLNQNGRGNLHITSSFNLNFQSDFIDAIWKQLSTMKVLKDSFKL